MPLFFTIPGEPQPWERAGRNGSRTFTRNDHAAQMQTIRQWANLAIRQQPSMWTYPIADGHFWLGCKFYLGIANGRTRNCDLDNLIKLVCDALNGVVWLDDAQVAGILPGTCKILRTPERAVRTVVQIYHEADMEPDDLIKWGAR